MASVETSVLSRHGNIAVRDSGGNGLPILMLHGAGAAKEVFARQFDSLLAQTHRLIAIDLPGHGRSDDAIDPENAYTLPGLAWTAFDVLDALGIASAAIVGWSLGGHIAIEMMRIRPDALAGVMLTGAPPTAHGILGMLRAFQLRPELLFSSKETFTSQQAERYARLCYGTSITPALVEAVVRSDGRSRPVIYRSLMSGGVVDQRAIVETSFVPVAIVNGAEEPVLRLRYLEGVHYNRLWSGACQTIEGATHAPFLQRPEMYNLLLARFAASLIKQNDREVDQQVPATALRRA